MTPSKTIDSTVSTIEQLADDILAERAKAGDTEAFGELVRRHRVSARSWAQAMTKDIHMAEDIVQDSFIKAFLHVGQLIDPKRFMGWLQAIVRRQAQMKLRRGGPYRKERPFTSLVSSEAVDSAHVDWSDVEHILNFLSSRLAQKQDQLNPETLYLRKETIEMIQSFLYCLNRKERGIFEAYFFKQWSPDEIAAMFQTTTPSVYTYIYRAKRKVRQEHARQLLPSPSKLKPKGGSTMTKLTLPEERQPVSAFTFIDSIHKMLHMMGDEQQASELMGRSGCAFRLRISTLATYADGAFVFDWPKVLNHLFSELGYEAHVLSGQLPDEGLIPLTPVASAFPFVRANPKEVTAFVKKFIDAGTPVMFFDMYVQKPYTYEWSVIWGYNDEEQELYVTDPLAPYTKTLTYEELASSGLRFLCGISKKSEKEQAGTTEDAGRSGESIESLDFINYLKEKVRQIIEVGTKGDGYTPHTPFPTYVQGLEAYDAWLEHLKQEGNRVSLHGISYLAQVYADARRNAVAYLKDLTFQMEQEKQANAIGKSENVKSTVMAKDNEITELKKAISLYEQTAKEWQKLEELFPFLSGYGSLEPDSLREAAECLQRAKAAETEALQHLQTFYREV